MERDGDPEKTGGGGGRASRRGGLRPRILAICLLSFLPAYGVFFWHYLSTFEQARNAAVEHARLVARNIADRHRDIIQATRLELTEIMGLTAARTGSMPQCQEIFQRLVRENSWLAGAFVTDSSGNSLCTVEGLMTASRSTRPDFIAAKQSGRFSIGQYQIGQVSKRPTLPVSLPLFGDNGNFVGTLGATIDMAWLDEQRSSLATDALVTVLDAGRNVLYRTLDPDRFVGVPLPEVLQTDLAPGTFQGIGLDGIPRIFATVVVQEPYVEFQVGIPLGNIVAPVVEQAWQIGIALLVSALIGATLVYVGLGRFIIRPIDMLLDSARRIAQGEAYNVGDSSLAAPGEVGQLSREITKMALELQRRESFLRSITDHIPVSIAYIDSEGIYRFVNRTVETWFACPSSRIVGKETGEFTNARASNAPVTAVMTKEHRLNRVRSLAFPDGVTRWIDATYIPDIDENGDVRGYFRLVLDISERRRSEEKLRATSQLLDSIVENIPNMIFLKRASDLRFELFNRAGEKLLGHSRDELLGRSDYDFFPKEQADFFTAKDRYVLDQHEVVDIPEELIETQKGTRILHTQKLALRDGQGCPQYLLGISEDISERKRTERIQNEFISIVSHELRTPLTAIIGALGLLANGAYKTDSIQAKQLLDLAHKNSQRLNFLVNDLIDLERLATGKMPFESKVQELMPLIESAVRNNRIFADRYNVRLEMAERADGISVNVDAHRVEQVLANLLSNAAKFSPEASMVKIRVGKRDGMARVEVIDRGPGIPAEFRDRIFQKFAQADSSDTRKKGGTGLGLAITRELIERMGGRVGFESTEGQGATFFVDLPLA